MYSWKVQKRFRQLCELNNWLREQFPSHAKTLKFPPKTNLTFQGQEEFLKTRQKALQSYLQAITQIPDIMSSFQLQVFLEIPKHTSEPTGRVVLVPLPDNDFDPTEVSVPWKILTTTGVKVVFATENGTKPQGDQMLLSPQGVIFGQLGADDDPKLIYKELELDPAFCKPIKWAKIDPTKYDGILLGGGHAQGMRQYLESTILQDKIAQFWKLDRPVAAICHGALLLSRCKDPDTQKSVLYNKKTTTLPKYMENLGYYLTKWKHGRLYRTYELYCEDEVRSYLANPDQLLVGPTTLGKKGTLFTEKAAFLVQDGKFVSARWPGDAYLFGKKFLDLLSEEEPVSLQKEKSDQI